MRVRAFGTPGLLRLAPEQFRENIVGTGKIGKTRRVLVSMIGTSPGGIILVILLARRFGAQRVDFAAIKFFALGLIRQYVVGYGEFLEALLRLFVSGVEIGMQLFRQAAVSLLDVIRGGGARDPQNVIWVFHFRSVQQNVP